MYSKLTACTLKKQKKTFLFYYLTLNVLLPQKYAKNIKRENIQAQQKEITRFKIDSLKACYQNTKRYRTG